ncbi:hypothetical protein Adt_39969 [Abeliophyllum distichum]|uniref:Uncharacterized protein n=1 Tax=Abeliophyllum distichum TaxID=126358 RepID=A0ABD1Q8A7_9LAMI
MEMPLHMFQTMYQSRKLSKKKGKDEEPGWYYFCPWGSHKPLVTESPSSVKQWKKAWFWVTGNWQRVEDDPEANLDVPSVYGIASEWDALPRCELSREVVDMLRSIYQAPPATRRYEFILNRHRCMIELGLMTMDKDKRPRPALARLSKQKPRALASGTFEESRQKKVLEDLSRQVSKETVQASKVIEVEDSALEGDVPLSRKRKSRATGTGAPRGSVEIVDDYVTCSAPPLQRTLAVNTSGEVVLEDPPRLSRKLSGTEGGPYESKRRLRVLIGAPGAKIPDDMLRNVPFFPSMGAQAVKKYFTPKWEEFSSHGIWRTCWRPLDNANAAQKVASEALEAANIEKKRLLDEVQCLRGNLDSSENSRKEAESDVARLLGEKKEMEKRLGSAEAKLENA